MKNSTKKILQKFSRRMSADDWQNFCGKFEIEKKLNMKIKMLFLFFAVLSSGVSAATIEVVDSASLEIIQLTLLGEAGGEGEIGLRAVGQVILNRARQRRMSVVQVCLQPKQFSYWNSPKSPEHLAMLLQHKNAPLARKIAFEILMERDVLPELKSNHYHARSVLPRWAKIEKKECVIGNHIFYAIN